MALNAAVRSITVLNTDTVSTTKVVSGLGFQPKAMVAWISGRASSGIGLADHKRTVGFGVSASSRLVKITQAQNGVTTTSTDKEWRNDCLIATLTTAGVSNGRLDIQSIDAGGATFVVDAQFDTTVRVHILFLGGSDLANAAIGEFQMDNTTNPLSVTGLGFQPTCVFYIGAGDNDFANDPPSGVARGNLFGVMVSGTQQGHIEAADDDAVGTTETFAACHQGSECHMRLNPSGAENARLSFNSFDASGFTVNQVEADDDVVGYLALNITNAAVAEFNTRTDTNDIVISGLGFKPACGLVFSAHAAEDLPNDSHQPDTWSMGAFTSPTERAVHYTRSNTGVTTSAITTASAEDAVYIRGDASGAQVGAMDVKSVDSGGVTFVMDDPDPDSIFGFAILLGPAAAAEQPFISRDPRIRRAEIPIRGAVMGGVH